MFVGKKFCQSFWKRLFTISLEGMNIGTGGGSVRTSGESYVIHKVLGGIEKPVVFDVGAQGGDYLREVLKATQDKAVIHAFEPNSKDYAILEQEVGSRVVMVNRALGDSNGEVTLYFPDGISGLSSLHGGDGRFTKSEKVQIETLDSYCKRQNIKKIDLLKLDVEGHELSCLKGAVSMLPYITHIQFEMSVASRDSKTYFRDIFNFLKDYKISRILRNGLEEVKTPDKFSELLFTTNYLAERK